MEEQVAQKSSELEQYLQRVRELEEMYKQLQEALEDEKQARQDEETVRKLQARYGFEQVAKCFSSPWEYLCPATNNCLPFGMGNQVQTQDRFYFSLRYEG